MPNESAAPSAAAEPAATPSTDSSSASLETSATPSPAATDSGPAQDKAPTGNAEQAAASKTPTPKPAPDLTAAIQNLQKMLQKAREQAEKENSAKAKNPLEEMIKLIRQMMSRERNKDSIQGCLAQFDEKSLQSFAKKMGMSDKQVKDIHNNLGKLAVRCMLNPSKTAQSIMEVAQEHMQQASAQQHDQPGKTEAAEASPSAAAAPAPAPQPASAPEDHVETTHTATPTPRPTASTEDKAEHSARSTDTSERHQGISEGRSEHGPTGGASHGIDADTSSPSLGSGSSGEGK